MCEKQSQLNQEAQYITADLMHAGKQLTHFDMKHMSQERYEQDEATALAHPGPPWTRTGWSSSVLQTRKPRAGRRLEKGRNPVHRWLQSGFLPSMQSGRCFPVVSLFPPKCKNSCLFQASQATLHHKPFLNQ